MNRNVWATIASSLAVVAVIILGFRFLGSPGTQRMVQSDVRTVRLLAELAQQINYKWNSSEKILPSNLDGLPDSKKQDPVTKKSFGFHRKADSNYELCATFATDNREVQASNSEDHWTHPKGDYCFEFDASQQVPNVPYYY